MAGKREAAADIYARLGRNLRAARLRAGLTQVEVAERAGLSTPFISFLESASKKGSVDSYDRLARAVGVPVADLFREEARPARPAAGPLDGLAATERRAVVQLLRSLRSRR